MFLQQWTRLPPLLKHARFVIATYYVGASISFYRIGSKLLSRCDALLSMGQTF